MSDRFIEAAEAFATLCRTMAKLRAPGGCPWDAEQSFASLKPYLIEEAYETLEAIESGDPKAHCDELGDLLLQVVFQAEIANETQMFDAAAVARAINAKLIRRHPHVFGDAAVANDAKHALRNWETIKATERKADKGALDGVPRALPGLTRAYRTGEKAAAVGFDWPAIQGSIDKVSEEWQELQHAVETTDRQAITNEMGDTLFALVNLCRHLKLDPEDALRHTIEKFQKRFRYVEKHIQAQGKKMPDATLNEMNVLWEAAKAHDSGSD